MTAPVHPPLPPVAPHGGFPPPPPAAPRPPATRPPRFTKKAVFGGKPLATVFAAILLSVGFFVGAVGIPKVLVNSGPAAPAAPAAEGRSFRAEESFQLPRQSFQVTHQQDGDGGIVGSSGFFSAYVDAAPTVNYSKDQTLPDGSRGETLEVHLQGDLSTSGVVKRDPAGLGKVAWEEDLAPLPNYPYQAITKATLSFDNGTTVEASRETSYHVVVPVPPGANKLTKVVLTFDWLDQGRDIVFDVNPPA